MTREEFENLGIGETFQLGCRKFTVVETDEDNGCEGCFFEEDNYCYACLALDMQDKELTPSCCSVQRKDGKNIIFVEVEE